MKGRPGKSNSRSGPRKSPQPCESAIADRARSRQGKQPGEGQSERDSTPQEGGSSRVTLDPRSQDTPPPQKKGREETTQEPTRETPSDFSARPHPSEGREEGGREGERRPTSKEAEAEGGMGGGAGGWTSHCATNQSLQMSQITSEEHLKPLHLPYDGCGSLNKGDINTPHLRLPTPGQSRCSSDILAKLKRKQKENT